VKTSSKTLLSTTVRPLLIHDESRAILLDLELDIAPRVDTKRTANRNGDRDLTFPGDTHVVRLASNTTGANPVWEAVDDVLSGWLLLTVVGLAVGAGRAVVAASAGASAGVSPARVSDRVAMDAILLVLRTGMQWNA
jgi:hypothetical protein